MTEEAPLSGTGRGCQSIDEQKMPGASGITEVLLRIHHVYRHLDHIPSSSFIDLCTSPGFPLRAGLLSGVSYHVFAETKPIIPFLQLSGLISLKWSKTLKKHL